MAIEEVGAAGDRAVASSNASDPREEPCRKSPSSASAIWARRWPQTSSRPGHAVKGFDLVEAAKTAAAASGVAIAGTAREAVAKADTVITMLPAGKHVLAAHADLLPAAPKGALVIDCSTIDVESAKKAHEAGAAAGVLTLDAPVSGGVGGATAATLTFMCGGSDEAFAKAKPILENMGKRIVHCGGPGAGQAAKICNNMILGATMIVTCEAFALAEKLGLSRPRLCSMSPRPPRASRGRSPAIARFRGRFRLPRPIAATSPDSPRHSCSRI